MTVSATLTPWLIGAVLNTVLIAIAWNAPKKLLTPTGWLNAWLLGVLLWGSLGWQGYSVMVFYFLAGVAVTRIGKAEKESAGIAEGRSGVRGPENVWGSAFAATLCALGVWGLETFGTTGVGTAGILDQALKSEVWSVGLWILCLKLGYVASISTKLSDTCASEIGKVYGKRTFLITTLQPVPRGTEGAISLEGTLAGVAGSLVLALVSWGTGLISLTGVGFCLVAAFIATNAESLIGATLQDQVAWLTNELVNVINTLIGAGVAILLAVALFSLGGGAPGV